MATELQIRGELEHDIGALKGEIRRIAALSTDLKKRRTDLISKVGNSKEELAEDIARLKQGSLNLQGFQSRVKTGLITLRGQFQRFVIEDTILAQEIERAKKILEQFRREFKSADSVIHFGTAEANINVAEINLKIRLGGCTDFINKRLNPLISGFGNLNINLATSSAQTAYDDLRQLAGIVDDFTLSTVGAILKFYGFLLKRYPLLVKVLEQPRMGRGRVLE